MGVPPPTEEAFVDGSTGSSEVPSRVYFDVSIDGEETGRLVFKLFSDVLPRTTRNFGELCRGTTPNPEDPTKTLAYEGSGFHRIIPDFMAQLRWKRREEKGREGKRTEENGRESD